MKPASIIITRFPYTSQMGGEEIHTFAVAEHLRKIGHNVEFLSSCPILKRYAQSNGFKFRRIWLFKPPVSGVTLVLFTLFSPVLFLWSLLAVTLIRLTRVNPHFYCLSFTEKLLFSPWCYMYRIPMVWLEHARIGGWFHKNPWKFWYKIWGVDSLVTIVTVSKIMQHDLGIPEAKVILNAIDDKEFRRLHDGEILPDEVKGFLREHKIDVGYVGRLTEDKGMELLLEAKRLMPEVGFITIGSGPYRSELIDAGIQNYPFMDKAQIACFMQNLNVLVLPATKTDPFGLVVLEGMAAGVPVLVTNLAGVTDYLKNDIEVCITSVEDFVASLQVLVTDLKLQATLKEHGPKAIERFSYEKMLAEYAKLF